MRNRSPGPQLIITHSMQMSYRGLVGDGGREVIGVGAILASRKWNRNLCSCDEEVSRAHRAIDVLTTGSFGKRTKTVAAKLRAKRM